MIQTRRLVCFYNLAKFCFMLSVDITNTSIGLWFLVIRRVMVKNLYHLLYSITDVKNNPVGLLTFHYQSQLFYRRQTRASI